jgi:retron-type reverse transcriptase
MKRTGNLWERVTSWENLMQAAHAAARGKRTRPDVARFLHELEPNLCLLQRELEEGAYRPGGYRTFWIRDPKPRLISAASFRDRVVHHALTRVLEPVFERRFSDYSFASRKGFGQHRALKLARDACRRYRYVLKCDIRKYFPSIDHAILKDLIARVIKCPRTLELAGRIIDGSNEQEEAIEYFPGDSLFTPWERRRGLPIGNQTSQFFANVYLNPLDHFAMRELRPAVYLRYVDDFVLFGDDKRELRRMAERIREFLEGLRLIPHERKFRVYSCGEGVTLLGWRILPGQMRLARPNVVRMRRRLKKMAALYHAGRWRFEQVQCRVQAWLGHAAFGDTWRLRQNLFAQFILRAAEHGRSARGLVEQQSTERPRLEP